MSNALPVEYISRFKRTMRARFILVGAFVLAASALAGIVALMPAFFIVYYPHSVVEEEVQSVLVSQDAQRKEDGETASRIRVLLSELPPSSEEKPSISKVIEDVYASRPSGVSIGGIAYTRNDPSTITLVGVARSRDDVNAFRNTLDQDERFENVSVPVAALVGALEGNFTMTLRGKF